MRFPPLPSIAAAQRAHATVPLRYEDVVQDGRLTLEALAPALGEAVWRALLEPHPAAKMMREEGVVPILNRLVVEGAGGPFAVTRSMDATGCFDFAHVRGADGEVERILVRMWVEAFLPIGRQFGPPPEHAGERVCAGRIFAEHVMTRLFAEPAERKVRKLVGYPGVPEVPGESVARVEPASLMVLPEGARLLDAVPRLDPQPVVFATTHTDSNQHVNSLIYPHMFEDAALRRLSELGQDVGPLLARWAEAAFRKPAFAGESYRLVLQAFIWNGKPGVTGAFVPAAEAALPIASMRPHTWVRMLFEPGA